MKKRNKFISMLSILLAAVLFIETPANALAPISQDVIDKNELAAENVSEEAHGDYETFENHENFDAYEDFDTYEDVETSDLIMGEITEERTEYTKSFRLENGNNILVEYAMPIHYQDQNGEWTDYDNSLKPAKEEVIIEKALPVESIDKDDQIDEPISDDATEPAELQQDENIEAPDPEIQESDISTGDGFILDESINTSNDETIATEGNSYTVETETGAVTVETDTTDTDTTDTNAADTDTTDTNAADIDATVIKKYIETVDVYSTNKSDIDISFARESSENNMVFISDDINAVSWGYKNINVKSAKYKKMTVSKEGNDAFTVLDKLISTVEYESAFRNVDIELISTPFGIKENIILNNKTSENIFTSEYNIGDLSVEQINDRVIALLNSDGEVEYYISALYMFDANNETSEAITLNILENLDGKLTIELVADKEWLDDANREYPVTIDPSFITGQKWGNVQCAHLEKNHPDTAYGYGSSTGYTGTIYAGGYGSERYRSLIKLNSLPTLNKGDMIVNATINLVPYNQDYYTDMYVGLYEATSSWSQSTVTWNNQPSASETLIDYNNVYANKSSTYYSWDITKLAKNWYNGGTNNGFYLKTANSASNNQCAGFYSSNYPSISAIRPVFELTYRNNKGIEDYWSTTSFDVGNAGTIYVNDYSGSLTFITPMASTASPVMSTGINYIYNSYMAKEKYAVSSPYTGRGWRMNIQQTLLPSSKYGLTGDSADLFPYVYTDSDGTEHYFYKKTENNKTQYLDEDGLNLELTINDSDNNSKYTITDKDKNQLIFNSDGLLRLIKDAYGNTTTLSISSKKINSVSDASGNKIQFTLNENSYVTKITDPDKKTVSISHTSVGDVGAFISRITRNDGTHADFTYNSDGLMTSVTDSDGYKIVISYDKTSSKRVSKIIEYGKNGTVGITMTFNRSQYNTTIMQSSGVDGVFNNSDDIITTYQFDNYGRTKSTQSKTKDGLDMGAENYEYTSGEANSTGSNVKKTNRISAEHALGGNTVNYMRNHSFERDASWATASWLGTNTFTGNYVTTQKLYGQRSYCINVTSFENKSAGRVYQDITGLLPNHTYTLSGYIKVTSISGNQDVSGAFIDATSLNSDGTTPDFLSESISEITDTSINNGWRRVNVTFTVPSNSTKIRVNLALRAATGTAYFDGLQLEECGTPSPYNLIENSSLETYSGNLPTYWTNYQNLTLSDSADTVTTAQHQHGSTSFKIQGDVATIKTLYQKIPVSGSENDTYIVSGWGKADSVPTNTTRRFKISINVHYTDGTKTLKNSANFNSTVSGWQYISKAFDLSDGTSAVKTPDEVWIYLVYACEGNTAYFDNIQLVKEPAQSYTYDDDGNLISVAENAKQKSTMKYSDNKLIQSVDPKGYSYKYTYNNKGKVETATTQLGAKYTYTYDSKGNISQVNGVSSDNLNRIRAKQTINYPSASSTTYTVTSYDTRNMSSTSTYDSKDGTLKSITDHNGVATNYTYNTANDILTSVSKSGHTISYAYDNAYQNLVKISTPTTNYSFDYSEFGEKVKSNVGNRTLATYAYNSGGSLKRMTYGNGDYIAYSYDKYGNVKEKQVNGVVSYQGIADNAGDVTKAIDTLNHLQYDYVYDSTDRLISSVVTDTTTKKRKAMYEYDFDLNNNLAKFTTLTPTGKNKVAYTYRQDNLYKDLTLNNGTKIDFYYDYIGRPYKNVINTTNAITTQYTYHGITDNGTTYGNTLVRTEKTGDFSYLYHYDNNDNLIKIFRENSDGADYTLSERYSYDEIGQITKAEYLDRNEIHTYTYDKGGNIQSEKIYDTSSGSNVLTATNTYSYDETWGDLLTAYNGESITYDEIGNPLTYRNGITLDWTNGRQLASLHKDGLDATYSYDDSGMRLSKTVNGVEYTYLYHGGRLVQETIGNKILDYSYDAGGTIYAVRYKSTPDVAGVYYYYAHNTRGDIIGLYDRNGDLYARYTYDVWGDILSVTNAAGAEITSVGNIANLQPFKYRGYYYDSETGFYYVSSRYYDPEIGRFINADDEDILEVQDDLYDKNLYAYCDNNPVNRTDEEGDLWQLAFAGSGMLAVGTGFSLGTLGSSILIGLGAITPVGWAVIGTVAVASAIAIGVTYAKNKSNNKNKINNKTKSDKKKHTNEPSVKKERSKDPIAKRYRFNSRKKAKQAAQRAGRGKIRNDYSKRDAHYHPDVKAKYRRTPKGVSSHDHYYYPR